MDPSFKPDPQRKGFYYRRIEDIDRALKKLEAASLPKAVQFVTYYFACEKLARGIVGIYLQRPATKAYHHRTPLKLDEIKSAVVVLGLSISSDDLGYLFADSSEQHLLFASQCNSSARVLRNKFGHDFGPSNVEQILNHADFLIPKMGWFSWRCQPGSCLSEGKLQQYSVAIVLPRPSPTLAPPSFRP